MSAYRGDFKTIPIKQAVDSLLARQEMFNSAEQERRLARTGFVGLDENISALYPGGVYLVGARPGMGKTSFVLDVAKNVALNNQQPVCIFSLDWGAEQIAKRLLSKLARLPVEALIASEKEERIARAANALSEAPIFINDRCRTVWEFKAALKDLPSLALAIIDYLQLVGVGRRREPSAYALADIKQMALEWEIPVLLCSQLEPFEGTREDCRPLLSDLKGISSIVDADTVLLLYREEYYNKYCPEGERGRAECVVAKNSRNERRAAIRLKWEGEYGLFSSL